MNRGSGGFIGLPGSVVRVVMPIIIRVLMPFARSVLLPFIVIGLLAGCDGGGQVPVTMYPDDRIRTINAVDYTSVVASVSFNSGEVQDVFFTNDLPVTVGFSNIILNSPNSYEINWFEIIDGIRLPIASQSGEFDADSGGTTLDSGYSFAFDNNRTRGTNLTERENGTCPWIACNQQGGLLSPLDVTLITSESFGFSITRVGPREWLEVVDEGRQFNWLLSEYTDTSILLEDPSRGFRFDMDLSRGDIQIRETPADDFRLLYIMNSAQ